jgi:hypothetical protein
MARKLMWPVLVIGAAMIVLPFVISLPSRAAAGQKMIDSFHPIMQQASVNKTVDYEKTFEALRPVAIGGVQAAKEAPLLIGALAKQMHMTPAQVQQFMGSQFPAMGTMIASFPQLVPVFSKVPPGLDHYKPLVDTMQANVQNYAQISSLPDFRLFTWFFVIPGVMLVLIAAWGLGWLHALELRFHGHHPAPSH